MPSIFIWKSEKQITLKNTMRLYNGLHWILEENSNTSKSYKLLEQTVICGDSVIIFNIKYMPQDWIGNEVLEVTQMPYELIKIDNSVLTEKCLQYDQFPTDEILANDIITHVISKNCQQIVPIFSIFTPAYKTEYKIFRLYESLKNQTFTNWEWVVLDDSPDNITWDIIQFISKNDFRVKAYKLYPITEGNVGLAKNRVASLCDGKWLVELDHDDVLTKNCLQECYDASIKFPDAGFMYSDVCEVYENGEMKFYDHNWSGDWYARDDNTFDFGYAGHTWVKNDNKDYLTHHYPDINPLTIRFNISMPSHVRVWKRELYLKIGGHNKSTPVADDFELIVRTFLNSLSCYLTLFVI
jgi:hypothetical protein